MWGLRSTPVPNTLHYAVVIGAISDGGLLREAVLCLAPGGYLSNAGVLFADTPRRCGRCTSET